MSRQISAIVPVAQAGALQSAQASELEASSTAPYGLASYSFDGSGVPGRRVEIVKDSVLAAAWATKQQADYLKIAATGGFSNWELPAGKTPLAELTAGDGPVLYVRNFSWLTPDQARGNFGSEVRIGYLYEKGMRKPIKGGTVSGNVFAALGTARYSKETVFLGNYMGPAAVRFENLTVAGGKGGAARRRGHRAEVEETDAHIPAATHAYPG